MRGQQKSNSVSGEGDLVPQRGSGPDRMRGVGASNERLNAPGNERTPRSSAVQRSRSSVERTAPRMVGNDSRKSPSRHERKPSAQEEKLQALMQRLDSLDNVSGSPSSSTSRMHTSQTDLSYGGSPQYHPLDANRRGMSPSPSSSSSQQQQPPRKSFSRENIQQTIDNAKRWVNTDDNVQLRAKPRVSPGSNLGRPQSFHVGERGALQMQGAGQQRRQRAGSEEPGGLGGPGVDDTRLQGMWFICRLFYVST